MGKVISRYKHLVPSCKVLFYTWLGDIVSLLVNGKMSIIFFLSRNQGSDTLSLHILVN